MRKKLKGGGIDPAFVVFAIIVAIIVVLMTFRIVLLFIKQYHKHKRVHTCKKEHMTQSYDSPNLSQAASSIDSENQFAETGTQWKGQPNKCYSCEKEMQAMSGDQSVYQATKTKCFDC